MPSVTIVTVCGVWVSVPDPVTCVREPENWVLWLTWEQQLELCGAVLWYHKALCVSGCCAGAVFWVGTWSLTGRFGVVHQWSSSGPRHQRCIYTSRTADVWESHDGRTTPSWWTVSAWQCRHSAAAETRPERHGDNVCSRHTRPVRHCMSYSLVVVDSPPLDNLWAMIIV